MGNGSCCVARNEKQDSKDPGDDKGQKKDRFYSLKPEVKKEINQETQQTLHTHVGPTEVSQTLGTQPDGGDPNENLFTDGDPEGQLDSNLNTRRKGKMPDSQKNSRLETPKKGENFPEEHKTRLEENEPKKQQGPESDNSNDKYFKSAKLISKEEETKQSHAQPTHVQEEKISKETEHTHHKEGGKAENEGNQPEFNAGETLEELTEPNPVQAELADTLEPNQELTEPAAHFEGDSNTQPEHHLEAAPQDKNEAQQEENSTHNKPEEVISHEKPSVEEHKLPEAESKVHANEPEEKENKQESQPETTAVHHEAKDEGKHGLEIKHSESESTQPAGEQTLLDTTENSSTKEENESFSKDERQSATKDERKSQSKNENTTTRSGRRDQKTKTMGPRSKVAFEYTPKGENLEIETEEQPTTSDQRPSNKKGKIVQYTPKGTQSNETFETNTEEQPASDQRRSQPRSKTILYTPKGSQTNETIEEQQKASNPKAKVAYEYKAKSDKLQIETEEPSTTEQRNSQTRGKIVLYTPKDSQSNEPSETNTEETSTTSDQRPSNKRGKVAVQYTPKGTQSNETFEAEESTGQRPSNKKGKVVQYTPKGTQSNETFETNTEEAPSNERRSNTRSKTTLLYTPKTETEQQPSATEQRNSKNRGKVEVQYTPKGTQSNDNESFQGKSIVSSQLTESNESQESPEGRKFDRNKGKKNTFKKSDNVQVIYEERKSEPVKREKEQTEESTATRDSQGGERPKQFKPNAEGDDKTFPNTRLFKRYLTGMKPQ